MPGNLAVRVATLDDDHVKDNFANLKVEDLDVPTPGDSEVLVRMTLRPVNPTDLVSARGLYPGLKEKVPFTNGSEGVGVVESAGPRASKFKKGDRVVGASWGVGTWAHYVTVPEENLLAVPDGMDDKTAAQFYVNPMTVLGMVEVSEVSEGKYLLQGAAGSVLGRMLIQYCKHIGTKTINIVRRKEQIEELKALGADEVIDSSVEDVAARVKEITGGEGAWAALDPVAGDFTSAMLQSVRQGGTVRVYGALSGSQISFPIMDVLVTGKWLTGFILPVWLGGIGPERKAAALDRCMKLLADGVMTPLSGRSFPLSQVHQAVAASQAAGRGAKIFLAD